MPRRGLLRAGAGLLGAGLTPSLLAAAARAQTAPAAAGAVAVTLLGTGSPNPNPVRFSAATLVQAGGRGWTRRTYAGPLVVGEDLMRFVIGDTVTVRRWDAARQGYPG